MTFKVFKYQMPIQDAVELEMPKGAEILRIDVQREVLCMWALVQTDAPKVTRRFRIYGTGHDVDERGVFRGTFFHRNGALVFHVFETGEIA